MMEHKGCRAMSEMLVSILNQNYKPNPTVTMLLLLCVTGLALILITLTKAIANSIGGKIGEELWQAEWKSFKGRFSFTDKASSKPLSIKHLSNAKFWQKTARSIKTSSRIIPLTIVLPTGRSHQSVSPYLALSSDAVFIPEICLALATLTGRSAKLDVSTKLDIDVLQENEPTSTDDIETCWCSNLLLVGTPDVNTFLSHVIKKGFLSKMKVRPAF